MNADYVARLRETIERKQKIRAAFQSEAARDDNERQLRRAQDALCAAEAEAD